MRRVPLGYSERVWIRSKAVAEKMGVSQKKFSLFVDIDRTYLAFVGAGRGNVSLNNIKKIADGFNIVLVEFTQKIKESLIESLLNAVKG